MKKYTELNREELLALQAELIDLYEKEKAKGRKLDISRGKPGSEQLDLSMPMLNTITETSNLYDEDGIDLRNYGILDGIPEAKRLMGQIMGAREDQVIIFGNSSLNTMYDSIARAELFGIMGSTPWMKLDKIKWLCPVPGYDRHFAMTEHFGMEMISIPTDENGPDMDLVEQYVNNDPAVKGIWCVPAYSNPGGIVYSKETVRRFAALKPAAADFRIFWDNAYAIHTLYDDEDPGLLNILEECEKAGNPDIVYQFCSTSKITFPGSGVAAMSASPANVADIKSQMGRQTIGHDKINQLRHVRFFRDFDGLKAHMRKHAAVIRPKFEAVLSILDRELSGLGIAEWTRPRGGYFVSFNAMPGCAKNIVAKCKEAGVTMTGAGAAYPYGKDPQDSNIRIAPTLPPLSEIEEAIELFCICAKLAAVEKLLA